jgi:hypothetical protein
LRSLSDRRSLRIPAAFANSCLQNLREHNAALRAGCDADSGHASLTDSLYSLAKALLSAMGLFLRMQQQILAADYTHVEQLLRHTPTQALPGLTFSLRKDRRLVPACL